MATSEPDVYELPWRSGRKLRAAGLGLWTGVAFAVGVLLALGAAYLAESSSGGGLPKPAAVPRPHATLTLIVLPDAEGRVSGRPLRKTPLFIASLPERTHLVDIVGWIASSDSCRPHQGGQAHHVPPAAAGRVRAPLGRRLDAMPGAASRCRPGTGSSY